MVTQKTMLWVFIVCVVIFGLWVFVATVLEPAAGGGEGRIDLQETQRLDAKEARQIQIDEIYKEIGIKD